MELHQFRPPTMHRRPLPSLLSDSSSMPAADVGEQHAQVDPQKDGGHQNVDTLLVWFGDQFAGCPRLENNHTGDCRETGSTSKDDEKNSPTQLLVGLRTDPLVLEHKEQPNPSDGDQDPLHHQQGEDRQRIDDGRQRANRAPAVLDQHGETQQADEQVVGLEEDVVEISKDVDGEGGQAVDIAAPG